MKYWDASALVPLILEESNTKTLRNLFRKDQQMIVWWGSRLETLSALARNLREGHLNNHEVHMARAKLEQLLDSAFHIEPSEHVLERAERLLFTHMLRAADSLQLAGALIANYDKPKGKEFVCLDHRLREAAMKEGFNIIPPLL